MTKKRYRFNISGVVEKFVEQSLLYDFYGSLLTKHQQEIYEAYVLENYSPAEIADGLCISRQAVHDNIKKSTAALAEYEEKLGLVKRFLDIKEKLKKIEDCTDLSSAKQIAQSIANLL